MMNCRVCGRPLCPIMTLDNIPKAAQYLPQNYEESLSSGVSLRICACGGCGLVQHTEEAVPYYKAVIRSAAYSEEMKEFRLAQFSRIAADYHLVGKRVLEIGCGRGEYLSLLNETGLHATGIEDSAASVAACIDAGLDVVQSYLGDPASIENVPIVGYDAFFSFNYFEHLPDICSVLQNLKAFLSPNAIGVVEVPNFDMILKERMLSEIIPDHLYYFTSETLCNTMNINGFEIIHCMPVWHDYILSVHVKPRKLPDIKGLSRFKYALSDSILAFANEQPDVKIAIWGAGHQALTALAMCDKRTLERFCFIVDSAPFKQNRFAPVTGLPIVAPEALYKEGVTCVLVMAAAYSDEIVRGLRLQNNAMRIGVLRNNHIVCA